jgi:hypothetical protein
MTYQEAEQPKRIAFVTTRAHGTDGVSLEIANWAHVLKRMAKEYFWITGESDKPAGVSEVIPEAHFRHPVIEEINRQCFGRQTRNPTVGNRIREVVWVLKQRIREAIERFDAERLIAEKRVSIPMNIPLGLAVVETVMETGIGCSALHHDFFW